MDPIVWSCTPKMIHLPESKVDVPLEYSDKFNDSS